MYRVIGVKKNKAKQSQFHDLRTEMTAGVWFSGVFRHFSLEIHADLCYDKIDLHEAATKPR